MSKKVFWNGDDSLLATAQTDGRKETRFFQNLFHSHPTVPPEEQVNHKKSPKSGFLTPLLQLIPTKKTQNQACAPSPIRIVVKSSMVHRMVRMIGMIRIVRFHQNGHGDQSGVAKTFEIIRNPKCLINNAYSSDSKTD